MKTHSVRPMIRGPPIMRSRLGHTRHGISYLVEFLGVCVLLILGAAVAEVYLVSPPPAQQITSSTTVTSQSTTHITDAVTSHVQYSSSVKVECIPGRTVVSAFVTCTATIASAGTVGTGLTPNGTANFTAGGQGTFRPENCSAAGGSLVCTASYAPNPGSEGTHMVNANYAGNAFFAPSSASFALTATKRNSSIMVSCAPYSLQTGALATCSASVSDNSGIGSLAPGGQVSFSSNVTGSFSPSNCTLGSGNCSASYAPSLGSHGSALITASYNGDTDHKPGTGTSAIIFGKRSSSVSIQCSPPQLSANQIATCQVTVLDTGSGTQATPTGNVVFSTNSHGNFSSLNCSLVGGGCSFQYEPKPGSERNTMLSATYQGDDQHAPSSASGAGSFTLVVLPRSTSTSIICSPQTVPVNSGTDCNVQVTDAGTGPVISPSGNVTFTPSASGTFSKLWCALSYGSCSVIFTPGPGLEGQVSIKASYNGDLDHSISSNATQITSTVRSTSLLISCTPAAAGSTSTCTITVSDTDKGNMTVPTGIVDRFSDGGWGGSFGFPSCHLSSGSCTITFISSNSSKGFNLTISATYEGDYDHSSGTGTTTLTPS